MLFRSSNLPPELQIRIDQHLTWTMLSSNDDKTRFLTLALCGEAGELLEIIIGRDFASLATQDDIQKELADVGNYLYMLASHTKVDLPVIIAVSPSVMHAESIALACEIVVTTGKLANLVKKSWRGDFTLEEKAFEFQKRLKFVSYSVFYLAANLGINLPQSMLDKMLEVEEREIYRNRGT